MKPLEPMLVEITRGQVVETEHPVVAAVVDAGGSLVEGFGDTGREVPVRSTVKSLQALPLVSSGAADDLGVSSRELAVACASHNGEPGHVEVVERWLERLGLSVDSLRCGAARPMAAAWSELPDDYVMAKRRSKHNCSGKHAGFLTLARHLGTDPAAYLDPAGEVQRLVLGTVADRCGVPLEAAALGGDGCGAPVLSVPLHNLARGIASLLGADDAARRIVDAVAGHPWLVAGSHRFDTRVTELLAGSGFTKAGAEGVHVALLVGQQTALAVKSLTGDRRAAHAAMFELLVRHAAVDPGAVPDLARPKVTDDAGRVVGAIAVRGLDR